MEQPHRQQLHQLPLQRLPDQPKPTSSDCNNFVLRVSTPSGAKKNFCEYSCPETVREICHAKVPGWSMRPVQDITVTKLGSGLSNVNYRVTMTSSAVSVHCVLFRVYGKGISVLYDYTMEFQTFKMLSKFQIAP